MKDGACDNSSKKGVNSVLDSKSVTVNNCVDDTKISMCAACGKVGDNLKTCTSCKQVKYCNRDCQKLHWPKHKKECRQRSASLGNISKGISNISISVDNSSSLCAAAVDKKVSTDCIISDEELFQDPPPKEDCPICMLPIPFAKECGIAKSYMSCCGKFICNACISATDKQIMKGNMKDCCLFCREPTDLLDGKDPVTTPNPEDMKRLKRRMKLKDAGAFYELGCAYDMGTGVSKDRKKALELWARAAELDSLVAHNRIADAYFFGKGLQKNAEKAFYH